MLGQILEKHGLAAEALPPTALLAPGMERLAERGPALICLCYIGPHNAAHMKYALRRLRRRLSMAILVLGKLSPVPSPLADIKGPLPTKWKPLFEASAGCAFSSQKKEAQQTIKRLISNE